MQNLFLNLINVNMEFRTEDHLKKNIDSSYNITKILFRATQKQSFLYSLQFLKFLLKFISF